MVDDRQKHLAGIIDRLDIIFPLPEKVETFPDVLPVVVAAVRLVVTLEYTFPLGY